jgi:hypothetical protein
MREAGCNAVSAPLEIKKPTGCSEGGRSQAFIRFSTLAIISKYSRASDFC